MEIFILPSIQARWQFNSLILSLLASPHPSTLLSPVRSHHFAQLLSVSVWLHPYALRGYMGSTPYLLTPQWGSDTCEKTPRRPAHISIPHCRCDCLHTARPDAAWQRRCALEFSCQRVIPQRGRMESVICSYTPPPPPSPDAFRNRPWEVLASIRWSSEELGRMRPSGYFCLLSPFLYRKAGRGWNLVHKDSVQIGVTLMGNRNRGKDGGREWRHLQIPPSVLEKKTTKKHTPKTRARSQALPVVNTVEVIKQSRSNTHKDSQAVLFVHVALFSSHCPCVHPPFLQPHTQTHTHVHAHEIEGHW